MLSEVLWMPSLHGELGWWDEIINLIPVAAGVILVLYLYRSGRLRRDEADDEPPANPEADNPEAQTRA